MTIVVQRPSNEAELESYLLGLEVLWPFQIAAFAGDATASQLNQQYEHEATTQKV